MSACSPKRGNEEACNFVQNVYGERISWKTNYPIIVYASESFPEEYIPTLKRSLDTWVSATGKPLFKFGGKSTESGSTPKQDLKNIIYWMNSWSDEKASEQGLTTLFWIGDQIREADIRINHKNYNFYIDEPRATKDVHLQSLITHELGHVLGLKHIDNTESVMETFLSPDTERIDPKSVDKDSVKCEYG